MDVNKDLKSRYKKSPHLHSAAHVLADELSTKFNDKKHFAWYLRLALTHNHQLLWRVAGEVMEQKAKKPGALFVYLIKKYKDQKSAQDSHDTGSDSHKKDIAS